VLTGKLLPLVLSSLKSDEGPSRGLRRSAASGKTSSWQGQRRWRRGGRVVVVVVVEERSRAIGTSDNG
jgi:hypothetical protein